MRTVSIDLGGTRCRAAVVDSDGRLIEVIRRNTPLTDREPGFLADMVAEVQARASIEEEAGSVVLGLPGVIDYPERRLLAAPNLSASWIQRMNEDWLSERIGLPVAMANDADLAAVGEALFGAGRGVDDVVYVTISTGVGAGAVIRGKVAQGVRSGIEIGQLVIDRVAAEAGQPCTVEDLGSGTAIARMAAAAGYHQRGVEFADLVRMGDKVAESIWIDAIEAAAFGVSAAAWMIVPSRIVIGGGVGCNEDLVLPILERQLKAYGPVADYPIEVVSATLGDNAALVGGAGWYRAAGRQN